MPAFCYHRPATVEEAVGLLADHGPDAKVLAGGQSLGPRRGAPDGSGGARAGEPPPPPAAFFLASRPPPLDAPEPPPAVRFPPWPPSTGWSVAEISRRHGDYALVGLAAVVGLGEGGRV